MTAAPASKREPLATPAEVEAWLGKKPGYLRNLRRRKRGPRAIRLDDATYRYVWADVFTWVRAQLVWPDSDG